MSARRMVLVAVTAWLAVVALGSAVVWGVISRAGQEVVPAAEPEIVARTEPATPAPSTARSPDRTRHPAKSPSSPDTTPSGPAAPTSAATPADPGTTPADASTAPPPESLPATQRRTWQGPGGFVSAECRGSRISLQAAQADAGFAVHVDERGPEEVKVHFEGREDEGRESEVEGRCRDGVPVFDAHSDD